MKGEHGAAIDRPREAAFAFLDDPTNIQKIVPSPVDRGISTRPPNTPARPFRTPTRRRAAK